MFCKHCGRNIDGSLKRCPNCGNAVVFEGGNGFWDIAKLAGEDTQIVKSVPAVPDTAPDRSRKKPNLIRLLIEIITALALLLCIAGIVLLNRRIDRLEQNMSKIAGSVNELQVKTGIPSLPSPAPEFTPNPEPEETAPIITKQPTSEDVQEGDSKTIFSVRVEHDENYDHQWQRIEKEEYVTLTEVRLSELGVEEYSTAGEYILKANGIKYEAEGRYRFVLISQTGEETASDDVTLTVHRNYRFSENESVSGGNNET